MQNISNIQIEVFIKSSGPWPGFTLHIWKKFSNFFVFLVVFSYDEEPNDVDPICKEYLINIFAGKLRKKT